MDEDDGHIIAGWGAVAEIIDLFAQIIHDGRRIALRGSFERIEQAFFAKTIPLWRK
jgi:hypothetical protein